MKKLLKSRKGEGYVDTVVGLFVLLAFVALALNLYSFFTLKQDMDEISEQLISVATENGSFGDAFDDRAASLRNQFNLDFDVSCSADSWYNGEYGQVDHGTVMTVTVSTESEILGLGRYVNIPVHVVSTRSGLARHYWKEDVNAVPEVTDSAP